jgi:hypothetical protein
VKLDTFESTDLKKKNVSQKEKEKRFWFTSPHSSGPNRTWAFCTADIHMDGYLAISHQRATCTIEPVVNIIE